MKKTIIILALLPFLGAAVHAQDANEGLTMICKTSDGTLTISEHSVQLADYQLQFNGFIADGVVKYADPNGNVFAVLDARADDGLYLEVEENGKLMQVVAPRSDIRYRFDSGSGTSAPSWSSVLGRFTKSGHTSSK